MRPIARACDFAFRRRIATIPIAAAASTPAAAYSHVRELVGGLGFADSGPVLPQIKGGKIQLKDRTYDSLAQARDSMRKERNSAALWEYFDDGSKVWRVLNRD